MKERPILFKGDMVKAVLDGKKTQTRRIVKGTIDCECKGFAGNVAIFRKNRTGISEEGCVDVRCPYGNVGDRLWVRETWGYWECDVSGKDHFVYYADNTTRLFTNDRDHPCMDHCIGRFGKKIPSIHMPRWASRINLEVTEVRVERVQDISEDDAVAEGIDITKKWQTPPLISDDPTITAKEQFQLLWDSINKARGHGWEKNDWVWVLKTKPITK